MLRQSGGLPGDLPATALLRLPPRIADTQALLVRRLSVGDLRQYGLTPPAEGIFTRLRREGKAPAIVDKQIIQAIRTRRIEITASIESLDQTSLGLTGGTRIEADVLIAATGYTPGLEPLAGHLGVLDQRGLPRRHGGEAAAPACASSATSPAPARSARSAAKPGEPPRQSRTRSSRQPPGPARRTRPDPRERRFAAAITAPAWRTLTRVRDFITSRHPNAYIRRQPRSSACQPACPQTGRSARRYAPRATQDSAIRIRQGGIPEM